MQRLTLKVLFASIVSIAAFGAVNAQAQTIDQRSPEYQAMMDHFGNLSMALMKAKQQAKLAEQNNVLQGYDYKKLIKDISQIKAQVDLLLQVRHKRLEYKTLTPDSTYFVTPPSMAAINNNSTGN